MSDPRRRRFTAGLILIGVGLTLYFLQRVELGESVVFFILGVAFLTAYLYQRRFGLLVPAGVLLGLGLGSVWEGSFLAFGESTLLGLGLGFIAIYVIALLYERRSHWWALIPGGILVLAALPTTERVLHYLFDNWPLILVVIGVTILIGGLRKFPEKESSGSPSPPADEVD
jgi:hypothetical protein